MCSVHFYKVLWETGIESGQGTLYLRTFVQCRHELLRVRKKCLDVASLAVLHIDFQSVTRAVAHNHRRCKSEHLRILDVGCPCEYLLYDGILTVLLALALVPMFQADDERTGGTALSTAHEVVAADGRKEVDLRNIVQPLLHLRHGLLRLVERAARRSCYGNEHGAGVLVGDKSRLGGLHQHDKQHGGGGKCHANHPLTAEKEFHSGLVLCEHTVECRVESNVEA